MNLKSAKLEHISLHLSRIRKINSSLDEEYLERNKKSSLTQIYRSILYLKGLILYDKREFW